MALIDGIGYKVVKTLATAPANKNYIRVKQADDLSIKNYFNVIETTADHKDYINVLVVTHDEPKNYVLVNYPITFERQWTIGNLGDDYGYHVPNGYGDLVANDWFNFIDTVDVLIVDDSANAVVLQSNVSGMWGLVTNVTLNVEGFGEIILTWNGATSYVNVGDTAFVTYIMGQLGNSIGVDILPKNGASPTSINEITTLLDDIVTTLGDNIIHTGN